MKLSGRVRLALRLIAPVLLLVVLWRLGDPRLLFDTLSRAAPLPLLAALVLNVPVNHLKVMRWRALLLARGFDYSIGKCWTAVLPSLYLGAITPGRVGDVLRIQYLSHDLGAPYAEGLSVTVMDRFCDLWVLSAFVALGVGHFAAILKGELAFVTWAAVALSMLGPLPLLIPGVAERVMGRLYRRLSPDGTGLDRFLTSLRSLVGKALALRALPLTVASFLCTYLQGWLLARALQLDIGLVDVMGMMAITSLLGLMPVSLSGLGVRELFLALLFPFLGLTPEAGVAFGLVIFAAIFLVNVIAGFIAWQIAPPPFERASDEV
jgi:uncharacterized protein (TIRG00374 family)